MKKKAAVIPFPQTLAFRLMLLTLSVLVFFFSIYRAFSSFRGDNTTAMTIFVGLTLASGYAVFYNIEHVKDARISPVAMKRMKRR